jgi:hypothetical protein
MPGLPCFALEGMVRRAEFGVNQQWLQLSTRRRWGVIRL